MVDGTAKKLSIMDNILAGKQNKKKFTGKVLLKEKNIAKETEELIQEYKVKCSGKNQEIGMLSGGNIQKVVVAREFSDNPQLILVDQPARGIDVGAKSEIYSLIERISGEGASVIIISSEIPEVQSICDRIAIMKEGEVVKILQLDEFRNAETILKYSIGG